MMNGGSMFCSLVLLSPAEPKKIVKVASANVIVFLQIQAQTARASQIICLCTLYCQGRKDGGEKLRDTTRSGAETEP